MKIEIKKVKLSDIRMNPDNPRTISEKAMERLVKSLKEFPDMLNLREIVVDETMTVLGGNMRLLALQKIGTKDCTAKIVTGLTDDQKREFIIKDNSAFGEWDLDALANAWSDLPLADWGIDLPDEWLNTKTEDNRDSEPQIDRAEELNQKWDVKAGDLWLIGEHRLLCGDSTKAEDVSKVMGGGMADMLLTDPPYGVSYVGKTADALTIENDALDDEELASLVLSVFNNAQSICRGGAYWYATVPPGPLHLIFASDWKQRGILRQIMVWAKDSMVLGHSEYHYQHEPILFGWIPGKRHKNPDRTRTTLWKYDRPKASHEHPTMKPVELWMQAVKDGSIQGESVFDPFLGSGTTMVACQNLNRKCRGIEISTNYCAVILERMITAFPEIDIRRAE
jgi:DNA modification methylase